MTFNFLYKK
uniref:Uncharacterized protein n=1 Tax=Arundo donax TaxID=35708 RepID=A0A0A9CAH3_ARUDO